MKNNPPDAPFEATCGQRVLHARFGDGGVLEIQAEDEPLAALQLHQWRFHAAGIGERNLACRGRFRGFVELFAQGLGSRCIGLCVQHVPTARLAQPAR